MRRHSVRPMPLAIAVLAGFITIQCATVLRAQDQSLAQRREALVKRGGLQAACSYAPYLDFRQYKANLHCHTSHSDGSQTCDLVANWYRENGYQILSMTDHDAYGDQDGGILSAKFQNDKVVHDWDGDGVLHETREPKSGIETYVRDYSQPSPAWVPRDWNMSRPGEFVIINGLEASFGHPHTNAIGCPAGKIPRPREGYGVIDWTHGSGGLIFINHSSGYNQRYESLFEKYPDLGRMDGLEVMNGFTARDNRKGTNADGKPGFAEPLWNGCLDMGKRVWGFANDDAHTIDTAHFAGVGSAWNMVWAKELTAPAVMEALRAGAFYATCGIIIDKVALTADSLTVHSPNATHIEVIGDGGRVLARADAAELTYKLAGDEKWVRVVLWNDTMCYPAPEPQYPQKAWMQPITLESLLQKP